MIMLDKFTDRPPYRSFSKQDHALQARFFDGLHEALGVGVQIRGLWWQLHRLHSNGPESLRKVCGEQRISVVDQVPFATRKPSAASVRLRATWLIQPARETNSSRKGSEVMRIKGAYHSEPAHDGANLGSRGSSDVLPFREVRILGHYAISLITLVAKCAGTRSAEIRTLRVMWRRPEPELRRSCGSCRVSPRPYQ